MSKLNFEFDFFINKELNLKICQRVVVQVEVQNSNQ
jgi:hypothetical protein